VQGIQQRAIIMSQATFSESKTRHGVQDHEVGEGYIAKMIEEQTVKLPSDVFLWAAGGSMVASAAFQLMGENRKALFVGQWAPAFLLLGLYNKIVKLQGSE
jgi:hypothetical protein